MRIADYLNVDGLRVVKFPINHILNGTPAQIEHAFKELMDLIAYSIPAGKGAQR